MTTAGAVWAAFTAVGVGYEAYTLFNRREEDTLSATTRAVFRTRTSSTGRKVFLVVWVGFSAWFTGHVLDWWW